MRSPARPTPQLLILVIGAALALNQVRATAATWGTFILHHPGFSDFSSCFYLMARVGLHLGWSRLYDLGAQRQEWLALGGPDAMPWFPTLLAPPVAWLAAPLALLPLPVALACWTALLVGLLFLGCHLVAPGRTRLARWTAVCAALALFPVLFAVVLGDVLIVELVAVAAAWWFLRQRREVVAGLLLTALVFKPQVAFLVPFTLLVTGYWRTVLSWAVGSAGIAAIAVATTGLDGMHAWAVRLVGAAAAGPEVLVPAQFTIQGLLGHGVGPFFVRCLIVVLSLAVAYRQRASGIALPMAVGLVGSLLVTPYLHDQDLATLLLAGAIALYGSLDQWQRRILVAGYLLLLAISYWGFDGRGVLLGPVLVVTEIAWVLAAWRLTASPTAAAPLESVSQPAA